MKSKGFTLVELLGVIVILAILFLIATPAVTSMITKSQKGTFMTEVQQFGKDAQNTYLADATSSNSNTNCTIVMMKALVANLIHIN